MANVEHLKRKKYKKDKNGKFQSNLDFSELENDPYIQKWLNGIKSTRERLSLMQRFCNFIEKNPSELAKEHNEDLQKDPLKKTNIAKNQLNAFFGYLTDTDDEKWKNTLNNKRIETKINWNSAIQYVFSKVLSFYSRLEIPVKYHKKEKPKISDKNINEKTWRHNKDLIVNENKKDYLKQIKDTFINILDRTIFICKLGSALDDIDLFNLKIRDFKQGYIKEYNICYLQGNRQKDGIIYQTFFNTEACNSINIYLKERERKGEKIYDNNGDYLKKALNFWLFVSKKKTNNIYSKMQPRYFTETLKEVIEKIDLENITPKSLRRWFSTTLERNSINKGVIKRFMGQKGDVQDKHYNMILEQAKEGEVGEFAKFYYEKIDSLVSLGNGNQKVSEVGKKVERLEIENEALKDKLTNMKSEYDKKLNDLEDFIKQLDQKISKGIIGGQVSQFQEFFKAIGKEVDITEITKFLSKPFKEEIIINPDLGEGRSKKMKKDK